MSGRRGGRRVSSRSESETDAKKRRNQRRETAGGKETEDFRYFGEAADVSFRKEGMKMTDLF